MSGINQQSLTESAYEAILAMILDGRLGSGSRLQERRLAEDLGLSRTPVRDALGRLESEGFVSRQDRLSIVRTISVKDFFEILHVRALLETDAVKLACDRIPPDELARVKAALLRLGGLPTISRSEHRDIDDNLHGMILHHAGNDLLASLVMQLRKKTRMFDLTRIPERFKPVVEEHLAIIEALEKRDAVAASAAVAQHLDNVRHSIITWISGIGRRPGDAAA